MPLPQEIKPLNSEIQDSLVKAQDGKWLEYEPDASLKILYLGSESGSWAVLLR